MDNDDRESVENQSAGDAHLIRMIVPADDAAATGRIVSFSFGDGKCTGALFQFLSTFSNIFIEFFPHGFQIMGMLINKTSKSYDMISYMTFKKDKIFEYSFFPQNIRSNSDRSINSLTVKLVTTQITSGFKKAKGSTVLRFELKNDNPKFEMFVINGASVIPHFLDYEIIQSIPCPIHSSIVDQKTEPNHKLTSELLASIINTAGAKYNNVAYDYRISIYKGGITMQTNAPSMGIVPFGEISGEPLVFNLEHSTTKYLNKLHKITPRGTILITAVDNSIFKISMPIGSCGDGFIFQYPKATNYMIPYGQQQISYGTDQIERTPRIQNYPVDYTQYQNVNPKV